MKRILMIALLCASTSINAGLFDFLTGRTQATQELQVVANASDYINSITDTSRTIADLEEKLAEVIKPVKQGVFRLSWHNKDTGALVTRDLVNRDDTNLLPAKDEIAFDKKNNQYSISISYGTPDKFAKS